MKLRNLFFLLLCFIEIYGQRIRTTNTNQDVSTEEPKTIRSRGRTRFSATQELPQSSERPSSNRRASTRTRIHSNNPKAAADRRARPTEAPRGYAVEEINNDSPIDSFLRQSKPRVLTESRFDIPTVTASRRSQSFASARTSPLPTPVEALPNRDLTFGSTARAILQARGETVPPKTTTPVIDEAYLLNNFGSTIKSLAAARNEVPIQRATPLRSEVPILDEEDIPSRRFLLRGDPLPSLRGSDVTVDRRPLSRSRSRAQATEQPRVNTRFESQRRTTEAIPVEDIRVEPDTEAPETVQGFFEQSVESLTEIQSSEASGEPLEFEEEEDLRKASSAEVETEPPRQTLINNRRNGASGRAEAGSELQPTSSPRTKVLRTRVPQKTIEVYTAPPARSRGAKRKYDDAVVAETRSRGPSIFTAEQYTQEVTSRSRTGRRIDSKIESVPERITVDLTSFTSARTRSPGRRATTAKTSNEISGRDRSSSRGRSRSRFSSEESKLVSPSKSTNSRQPSVTDDAFYGDRTVTRPDISKTTDDRETNSRQDAIESKPVINRDSSVENESTRETNDRLDTIESRAELGRGSSVETLSRRKPSSRRDATESRTVKSRGKSVETPLRRETSSKPDSIESRAPISRSSSVETPLRKEKNSRRDAINSRAAIRRGSSVEASTNRRGATNRADIISSRSRVPEIDNRRQIASKIESIEPINIISSRSSGYREYPIPDETIAYGEKSLRTRSPLYETTTSTTTEEPAIIRSKSRFSDVPPKIDESKLEVLPLFEREVKSVPSVRSRGHRSRSSVDSRQNLSQDHMHVSATENDVKFVEKPTTNAVTKVTITRTESVEASTSRTRLSTRTATPTTSTSTTGETRRPTSTSTTTTTEAHKPSTTTRKWVTRALPVIRESVVAEVNEVTSKSTITRRKKVPKAVAAEVMSRGNKKADVKLTEIGKKASSEEINEEDNYPEPFKALIQAKKKQEVSRPSQSSTRGAPAAISVTSTEKVFVTSVASPRGSSTARVVTTESTSPGKRTELVNKIVNDSENELDPKPYITSTTSITPTRAARLRQLPKFSEKPKYTQKPRDKYTKSITEKSRFASEKASTKTTATPKKSYSTKAYSTRDPAEHHYRRKVLRSTAFPPSTTPLNSVNREAKFSAKFIKKETKSLNLNNSGNNLQVKGSLSSKKGTEGQIREGEKTGKNVSLSEISNPSLPIKNTSRYSSRYRGDASQRSTVLKSTRPTNAPFYIPTIPTPAYVPTVPTITPSVTLVGGIVAVKDIDLGLEVISFDDPVNTIPSADLVNGEYLTTDKNFRISPMVKDGTTEKPVSIIERIINSITSISTTAVPNITTTVTDSPSSTKNGATENSAILKLAPKKPTPKDKTIPDYQTNIIETITSEKPTTIIEKIRSSLSAIQSNEVGTLDFNSVSGPSTTPLSTVTKYSAKFRGSSVGTTALPAPQPLSTSVNPLSVFDEIDENQVLEKQTIGKLLNILNGLVSTNSSESSEKLVVVTPKTILNTGTSPAGFVATTYSSQEPLEAIALNEIESRSGFIDDSARSSPESSESSFIVNNESTTSGSTVNTESSTASSIVNTESSTVQMETVTINESTTLGVPKNTDAAAGTAPTNSLDNEISFVANTEISTPMSTQTDTITTQSSTTTTSDLSTTTSITSLATTAKSSDASANPLLNDFSTTSASTAQEFTTTEISETTTSSDTITTTPSLPATSNVDGFSGSTFYSYPSTIPTIPNIEVSQGSVSIFSANDLSNFITPDDNLFNTVTIASRVGFDNNLLTASTTSTTTEGVTSTTTDLSTSTESAAVVATTEGTDITTTVPNADGTTTSNSIGADITTILSTAVSEESTTVLTTTLSSNTSNSNVSVNSPILSNRSGRILSSAIEDLVGNSIDISTPSTTTSTTPDYFIFAVLNNNTILRKRPPTIPNKDTPFLIVGLYPNNTIVKKFPNGTLVPMEPIIQVRGFDTRPNPPPLVEITSNQVTDTTNGMTSLDNSVTVESNRIGRLLDSDQSVDRFPSRIGISSTTSSTAPSTTVVSSTTASTTTTMNEPKISNTANSVPSSSSLVSSTTTSENSVPSTTTPGTTMMFTSTLSSSTTSQGTTMASNIVKIMAVPVETRISEEQTTTAEPSTVQSSTTQALTSTIAQSTETIPPTLIEILNGKTVDALANLLTNVEIPTTKASNFKTLEVNQYNAVLNIQDLINRNNGNVVYRWKPVTKSEYTNIKNSFTSTATVQSTTTELPTERNEPFTSPVLSTESTTQFSTSADRLLSSTLISTLTPPETTTQKVTITSTTPPPTTIIRTTPETKPTTQRADMITRRLTTIAPQAKTTTGFSTFSPSTILPTILTTFFPNLLRDTVTTPSTPLSSTGKLFTSAEFSNTIGDGFELLSTAGSTARPTTVLPQASAPQGISTTTVSTTTARQTTTQTTTESTSTTTTQIPTTTVKQIPTTTRSGRSATVTPSTKEETDALFDQLKNSGKLKNLNEEQRKNLEEIEKIEKEQAELLKQLTLLTTMFRGQGGNLPNLPPLPNNNPVGGNSNSLANRVIAMAMERDRTARASTVSPVIATTKKVARSTTKRPNSIQDQLPVSQQTVDVTQRTTPSLEDILKQYNLNGLSTPVPLSSTYGKTDEALLAAILREQGIGPTTPKVLGDKVKEAGIFEENPTTKPLKPKTKPRTTTARPIGGRLMQGLNWLLDVLDPPTTKKPALKRSKPKTQPAKQSSGDEELLTNQPTRITPVVTAAPVTKPNLSQEEIQALIKQLEAVQNDPSAAEQLDFSKIKSLQNLINVNEGVQVTSAGQHGATSRATSRPPRITSTTDKDPFLAEINKNPRSSTVSTISVSNSIDDDVELIPTTTRTRVLPPVSLNPIPGIDNQGESLIRSNLLTAAVNVTRAISSFLGSALQGASRGFRSLIGSGSAMVGNIAQTSNASTG